MDLKSFILNSLKEGKSLDQIKLEAVENFKEASAEEIADAILVCQKAFEADQLASKKQSEIEKQKEFDEKVQQSVQKILENTKVKGILEQGQNQAQPQVKESPELWKKEVGEYIKLSNKSEKTAEETSRVIELRQKFTNKWAEKYAELGMDTKALDGVIAGTDASGGYFMPPEFDMEVDKLVYSQSKLINIMKVRQGGEKTEINSISTFNLVHRSDENNAFSTTKPTFAQQELKYEELGAIVNISNRAMAGSAYNLGSELVDLASDAKIREMEAVITTGKASTTNPNNASDSFKFNGIWFTSGITSVDAKNKGGSGKIVSTDLTNLYLNAPSQTRAQGTFLMDSRELMVLLEEKATDGHYQKAVEVVGDKFIHVKTGKEIIPVDNMIRTLNGTTGYSGTDIPVIYAVLPRFRFYQLGGFRVDMSKERYFEYDQTGLRFILSYKQGIPTYSLSSFCILSGIKYNSAV